MIPPLLLCAAALAGQRAPSASPPADAPLRLDQIQILGTHNSYHLPPRGGIAAMGDWALEWRYAHLPLDRQLEEQGLRHFELDVWADPDGGLFDERSALGADPGESSPALCEPGFKVLHVPEFDWRSNHRTLRCALRAVRAWSDAHPGHLPLVLLIELKDEPARLRGQTVGSTVPRRFDPELLRALHAELLAELGRGRIFTPDDLRGSHDTIAAARAARGWPVLDVLRGRVVLALDNPGAHKRLYLDTFPCLRDALLFVDSRPGDGYAAFAKRNDPVREFEEIQHLVRAGFLVRTRADAGTAEARAGDTHRRDRALASGAQLVSTDFPVPDPALGTGYCVELPGGGPARVNPVSGTGVRAPESWEPSAAPGTSPVPSSDSLSD